MTHDNRWGLDPLFSYSSSSFAAAGSRVCVCVRAASKCNPTAFTRRCRVCRLPSCSSIQKKLDRKKKRRGRRKSRIFQMLISFFFLSSYLYKRVHWWCRWLGGWKRKHLKRVSSSSLYAAADAERSWAKEEAKHYAWQHLSPLCVPLRCIVLFNQTSFLVVPVVVPVCCFSSAAAVTFGRLASTMGPYWIARASLPLLLLPLSYLCLYTR